MDKDYAIVKIKGSQYKVSKSDKLEVERIEGKENDKLTFDEVLLTSKKGKVSIGTPTIKGENVEVKIIEQVKGKKIITFKYKAKSRYRKTKGHRQQYTRIEIVKI
ncbi:50S ribosomal protein L21 [Candidatus Dojkabacteria bacterium]|nr:50S ribosomal protein L21 [Candidatus Dojkabacteria bacterium]